MTFTGLNRVKSTCVLPLMLDGTNHGTLISSSSLSLAVSHCVRAVSFFDRAGVNSINFILDTPLTIFGIAIHSFGDQGSGQLPATVSNGNVSDLIVDRITTGDNDLDNTVLFDVIDDDLLAICSISS